jgi:ribosome maturation factor RimP
VSQFERERSLQERVERTLGSALPQVDVLDLELDDPRQTVRLFVDAEGGVTHELCAAVSSAIRDLCGDHALEVSSPGAERPLRRAEHFAAATGRKARFRQRGGGKRAFTATVVGVAGEAVTIRREDESEESLALADIARSHLVPEVDATAIGSAKDGRNRPRRTS